ncbi:cysteine synthase family protein [Sphingobacterium sp. UT-1RO-CII-1]|uniref:PLP-dependent cysteine synthase family protein n=1 Tax=Sphingobacterium sp. UT-1RO-CII-1 TaxID=2995225 RepID=UPI00227D1E6E|nr:cysteine synthase family protein [Sphingobacterium sp. UT-1RO-CII-1]MCY4780633.1 cysteine synthase family protein [Sphingobacterium sp. UT-1RO-CII-1]
MDKAITGNTPLERCPYLSDRYSCNILIKKEYFNPNKTCKDRPALYMIKDAIEKGRLQPGDTVVEASSGNTGIGIAQIANKMGFKCCIFVTENCAIEKLNVLEKLGSKIITCKNSNGIDDSDSTQYHAAKFANNTPSSFFTDQYNNPQNPQAHFETTGPEIWEQSSGLITHFFAGVGTGGTISGVGSYLKLKNNKVKIYGVEPRGSILSYFKKYGKLPTDGRVMDKIDGIGRKFVPKVFNPDVVDDIFQVDRQQAMQWADDYYKGQNIPLGFSSAALLVALEEYVKKNIIKQKDNIVLLFADYGDRYINSLYPALLKKEASHD